MTIKSHKSIDGAFEERASNIETIFSSFRSLHEMYVAVMRTAQVNKNALAAFERTKRSAELEQERISEELFAQGLVLLTGSAEALLKDVFESLLIENYTFIKGAKEVKLTVSEIQTILINSKDGLDSFEHLSSAFGRVTKRKIFDGAQNPSEKINFQNVKTMADLFDHYFGMKIDMPNVTKSLHRYWQVRHCLVHNNSLIDERFINNVRAVDLLKPTEKAGKILKISKNDYNEAKANFILLFNELNRLIMEKNLRSRFIADY